MLYMDINKQFAQLQEQVNNRINNYEQANILLKQENARLKSEHYENDEIKRLKQENEELRAKINCGFGITESEWENIQKWQKAYVKANFSQEE